MKSKYDVSLDMTLTIEITEGSSDEEIISAYCSKLFKMFEKGEIDDSYFTIEESEEE